MLKHLENFFWEALPLRLLFLGEQRRTNWEFIVRNISRSCEVRIPDAERSASIKFNMSPSFFSDLILRWRDMAVVSRNNLRHWLDHCRIERLPNRESRKFVNLPAIHAAEQWFQILLNSFAWKTSLKMPTIEPNKPLASNILSFTNNMLGKLLSSLCPGSSHANEGQGGLGEDGISKEGRRSRATPSACSKSGAGDQEQIVRDKLNVANKISACLVSRVIARSRGGLRPAPSA